MLISKTALVNWNAKNKNYYLDLGYIFTKMGNEFEVKIEDLSDGSHSLVKVKCDRCKEVLTVVWKSYKRYLKNNNLYYCNNCATKTYGNDNLRISLLKNGMSFAQWCTYNNKQEILDRWDYELNNCKPHEILKCSNKQYWFKCPRGLHKSEKKRINGIIRLQEKIICNSCYSFAQYLIDLYGYNALELYWDYEKNKNINPWEITKHFGKKVWLKCQEKSYHDSYSIAPTTFVTTNVRCSYCGITSIKIHYLDSIGNLHPKVILVWSDKNKKSPYEYAVHSSKVVLWRCENNIHDKYERKISDSFKSEFRCPKCNYSKGEKKIENYLLENNIIFEAQKEFEGLIGVGGGNLSYDFYSPNYNLLIEYQGEFHDGSSGEYSKKYLKTQKEHDKRKKEYIKKINFTLLEIWYWDFENIEKILNIYFKKEFYERKN